MSVSKNESVPHNKKTNFDEVCIWAVECFNELFVMAALGFWRLLVMIWRHPLLMFISVMALYFSSGLLALTEPYFQKDLFFVKSINDWFYQIGHEGRTVLIFSSWLSLAVVPIGFSLRFNRTKYKRLFEGIGIINKHQETPKLIKEIKLSKHRRKLVFDSPGIGIKKYEENKDNLESSFSKSIESITHGKNQRFIEIILNDNKIKSYVHYYEMQKELGLKKDSFYIGSSDNGAIAQNISELPHMLIAGTTGSGKSVYFKQVLLGLLKHSPHIQMYLVDLKGGLEMIDFKEAPNVEIVKDMPEALGLLKGIKEEMTRRFKYLESKGLKSIDPARDKMDRIVVGIDESSVLYMTRPKTDPEAVIAKEARSITDHLAKLSRAAGIHLILATQKVSKETIDTTIQENISARMCFKMNTLQNSLIVLGRKDALDLPDIKGRGIWNFGNTYIEAQAPYISEDDIKTEVKKIKQQFKDNKREMFGEKLFDKNNVSSLTKSLYENSAEEDSE